MLFVVPLLYAAVVFYLIILMVKKRSTVPFNTAAQKLPGISIVIPFRNEAGNLPGLLASLDEQTYAGDFEIVLVNDGSTDNFHKAIGSRSEAKSGSDSQPLNRPLPQLRVINSPSAPAGRLTNKQRALDLGIREAQHEWIALTDADMVFNPGWLETLIKPAAGGAKLVFGHTSIFEGRKKTFLSWLQSFQLDTLFSFAYALHRAGITGSCMGNNMMISRETYLAIGGFESIGYSIVEDRDLLAAFRSKKIPVGATDPFLPSAFTMPCENLLRYRHQLLRWARGGFKKRSILSFFGVLLLVHTLLFLIASTGALPVSLWVAGLANQLLTWLFIAISFKKIGSTRSPLLFPLFFAVFLVEALLLAITFITNKRLLWKEREL